MKICLNADVGEGFGRFAMGNDQALIPLISAANIACGMHAGDPTIMARTVAIALENGSSIGAHPGFNDLWGFGRRRIQMSPSDIEHLVTYQIGALQAIAQAQGARVAHVKPHGALNNMAHSEIEVARAVGRGIHAADRDLIFVANVGSQMTRAGKELGLRVANEAYADRVYDDTGLMVSRSDGGAVIQDPEIAARQVRDIITNGALLSVNGRRIPAKVDTFCIHGDEPHAVAIAAAVQACLKSTGIDILPMNKVV